jgi:hypothetical protein
MRFDGRSTLKQSSTSQVRRRRLEEEKGMSGKLQFWKDSIMRYHVFGSGRRYQPAESAAICEAVEVGPFSAASALP